MRTGFAPRRKSFRNAPLSIAARRAVAPRVRHALGLIERLEERRLLSAAITNDAANLGKFTVSLLEDVAGANDALSLRVASGQLQYKLNAADFTSDLNSSSPGVQALSLSQISRLDISLLTGNDALTLDFDGGSVIPMISGVSYVGGAGSDLINVSTDANFTLTNSSLNISPGGIVNLNGIERANLVGGNSLNLMDASAFTGSVTMDGQGQDDTLIGGAGNDVLVGTQGSDQIEGRGGNDVLYSGNSGSTVYGGDGNDTLIGDNGKDFLFGQGGDDLLFGNNGADVLSGDAGNDTLDGGGGNDAIAGGEGVDAVQAIGGVSFVLTNSTLTGLGTDSLTSIEAAILTGGTNNNTLDASAFTGSTTLNGGGGADVLIGGSGANNFVNNQAGDTTIVGGSGTNVANLTPSGFVSLSDSGGLDDINFSTSQTGITIDLAKSNGTGQNVDGNGFTVSLNGTFENVIGTAFTDDVLGNTADNIIYGGLGADRIDGAAGNDIIYGGTGGALGNSADSDGSNDIIYGGLGTDQIDGGTGDDIIYGGTGGVFVSTSDQDNSNDIIYGGIGNDRVDAGAGNDVIFGGTSTATGDSDNAIGTSNDVIYGGLGADQIDGGAGNDIIFGGTATSASDSDASNDIIYGGLGADQIDGGAGNDIIFGGTASGTTDRESASGNDIIYGGLGRDQIDGGAGNDIIYGGTGGAINSTADQDASNDIIYGGLGADQVDAGAGNDIIFGGTGSPDTDIAAGNDIIYGSAGNDILGGGTGDDALIGGTGNDTYLFISTNLGSDTITEDASLGTDTLDFSAFGAAVTLDLAQTSTQVISSGNLSLALSSDTGIENVVGGKFADTIYGNARDNKIFGADQLDDRFANPATWQGVTQVVFLDFDSNHSQLVTNDHVYTQAERDAIQARLTADYASFHFQFTQAQPSGQYATLFFNKSPIINGTPQPGGLASELDFRNLNLSASAAIDINPFLGGHNQPEATSENYIAFSATVASHELGHTLGLRHLDSAGPIGFGIPARVPATDFLPAYPGPAQAFETNQHLMASPDSVGSTFFDAVGDAFFGEREAVKIAFDENGTAVNEQAGAHGSRATAQPLNLTSLAVPNTVVDGYNYGKDFAFAATDVVGSIGLNGGTSEDDFYSFTGRAGDVMNIQVMSNSITRIANKIDSILRVYDANGNVVAYFNSTGLNDDENEGRDSVLVDLVLPSDGTFFIQVDTFADASLGVADTDTGDYELFVYRFDAGNATDGGDYLDGRAGNDSLAGGLGDDILIGGPGVNVVDGGAGTDKIIESGDVNFALSNSNLTGAGSSSLMSIERATLTGGASGNTFNLNGWTGTALIDGGLGTNTLIGGNVANIWTMTTVGAGNINSTITYINIENFAGGTASDAFIWLNTPNAWSITASNAGNVGASNFTGMENLAGGSSSDSFTFATGAGVSGTINGGAGINSLNYAAFLTGVTVNMTTGVATATGGISNFQHVFGGAGNDNFTGNAAANLLVGNAGNDTAFGTDGRDILIGGLGGDLLDGGNDDDILIGARTSYDANVSALLAIAQEWTRTDVSYAGRRDHISGALAGGLNGTFVLNATTVFDDTRTIDTLWGRGGTDFFIYGTRDDVMDAVNGETTTKI
jgi:Ca2+-binding RTX toxin-like protein